MRPRVPLEADAQLAVFDGRLDHGEGLFVAPELERPLRADGDGRVDARLHRHRMEGRHLACLRLSPDLVAVFLLGSRKASRGGEQDEAHGCGGHTHRGTSQERALALTEVTASAFQFQAAGWPSVAAPGSGASRRYPHSLSGQAM